MLGVIDETAKPKLPQIYLAKPNREIIGKLNYFIHVPHQHDFNLGSLNEISFDMPYMVENPYKHELERNPYIDLILERYLLKITLGTDEEWYIIDEIDDNMDHEKDIKTIHAYSLGFEIGDKLIRDYEVVSYTLEEVATDALRYTLWSVGEIDEKFKDKRRSFEVSEKTALAFLEEIAEKFGAFIEYDTVNRKVHFRDPAKIGSYRGLNINYGKYLKSLGKTSNADEMVTRLRVYGENGLSITRVNPTGTPYIEDFSYFMYPFEMDENGNVIKHSRYMSDELCKAIIRYDELVKSKEGVFASLIDEMEYWQLKLMEVESELFLAETELKIIQERLDIQRSYETFLYHEKTYNNKSETINFTLNRSSKYAIFARINNSNLSITINNIAVSTPQINEWKVLRKITEQNTVQIKINGTGTIQLYIVEITDEDFESNDESIIINKYCEHKQQEIVNSIQSQWDNINAELTIVENEILDLKEELSIENNFSPELIKERNQFIIEKTWEDTSYFDDKELYEDAKEKFAELKKPKTSFDIDIINFMEVLEEQHNWNRLALGDDIRIQYDLMNINIQAKVIKISFNYQTKTIQLRIANVKEIEGKYTKLLDMLKSSYSTSTKVEMSKYKWDETTRKTNEVAQLMEQEHDATQRRIVAGANETVTIDNRGITIRNPDFPNEIIRMNSGVLALSKSDGLNWETAITPNGVVAEKLYGNLIAGQNLKITNEKGSFVFDENGLNIKYNDLMVVDEDGQNKFEKIDDNIKALSDHVNKEIDDLNKSISDLDNYIENVFRDSIIQEAEAKTIQTYLMDLEKEKLDLDAKYNEIYNNPLLSGTTEKSQLNSSKNNYNSKFNNLVSVINNVIADGKVTESERILVDTAFELYKQAITDLTVKLEQATNKIQFLLDEKINTKVDFEVYESKTSELTNDINGITANVSSLTTKVNNYGVQITDLQSNFNILADQISSKVERSEFDSVTNTLGNRISTIEQTADSISLEVSDIKENVYTKSEVDNAIGNIQVGGRNFLTNSDFSKTYKGESFTVDGKTYDTYPSQWGGYNSGINNPKTSYHAHIDNDTFGFNVVEFNESNGQRNWKGINQGHLQTRLSPAQTGIFTFSVDVYATGTGTRLFGGFYYFRKSDGQRGFHSGQFNIQPTEINKWVRMSAQCKLNDDVDFSKNIAFYIYGYNFTTNSILYIKNVKLEYGNKATDWTLAPEDIDERFTDIEGTLVSHSTRIEQNAQQIQLRATKAEVDTLTGRISNVESELNVMPDRITSAVQSGIDGLEIGGRNLLPNSDFSQGIKHWGVNGATYTISGNEITVTSDVNGSWPRLYVISDAIKNIKKGEVYTLSFEAKGHNSGPRFWRISMNTGENVVYRSPDITYTDEWKRYVYTFTAERDANEHTRLEFWIDDHQTPGRNSRSYRNIKLEKGNKATDWTPAPEDVQGQIDDIEGTLISHSTQIEQNAQQIQLRATKTEVDELSGRVNTVESTVQQTAENVSISFQRLNNIEGILDSAVTTIDRTGITVKDGSFFLEDDNVDTKYSIVPKTNLVADHSFELLQQIGNVSSYEDFDFLGSMDLFGGWRKVGSPRLASWRFTDATHVSHIIFGDQALVVNSSNYVRQAIPYVPGQTYTLSAYYMKSRRSSSGRPRLRVRLEDDRGNIKQTWSKDFPTVSTEKLTRVSLTFTVPTTADATLGGDVLVIELLTTNSNYLMVDGVQVVLGNYPVIYDPEDSIWEIAIGAQKVLFRPSILWSGVAYMNGNQTIYPSKKIRDCARGWVLVWSDYDPGVGANNFDIVYSLIPKEHANTFNGSGVHCIVSTGVNGTIATKYVYTYNDKIVGHDANQNAPLNDVCLRYVLEW